MRKIVGVQCIPKNVFAIFRNGLKIGGREKNTQATPVHRRGHARIAKHRGLHKFAVIPKPGGGESGRFVTRVPKSLHTRLVARADQEGCSMNTLVESLIAEGVGART